MKVVVSLKEKTTATRLIARACWTTIIVACRTNELAAGWVRVCQSVCCVCECACTLHCILISSNVRVRVLKNIPLFTYLK